MLFALYGGDKRYACAVDWLRGRGEEARLCYAPSDCIQADCILLPAAPEEQEAKDIAGFARRDALFLLQRGPRAAGLRSYSLDEDEAYLDAVAHLTAEGAIFGAMGYRERALYGAKCVVYGYGRIGRALTGILRALRANVAVAVRSGASARKAAQDDVVRCGIEEAGAFLGSASYIWNTVPARVLSGKNLSLIPEGAMLADLASAPYGFDIVEARARGIQAERLPGLPGIYCPESAGEQLAMAALRAVGRDG